MLVAIGLGMPDEAGRLPHSLAGPDLVQGKFETHRPCSEPLK